MLLYCAAVPPGRYAVDSGTLVCVAVLFVLMECMLQVLVSPVRLLWWLEGLLAQLLKLLARPMEHHETVTQLHGSWGLYVPDGTSKVCGQLLDCVNAC